MVAANCAERLESAAHAGSATGSGAGGGGGSREAGGTWQRRHGLDRPALGVNWIKPHWSQRRTSLASTGARSVAIRFVGVPERGTLWHHAPKPGINGMEKVERGKLSPITLDDGFAAS